jgi:hypothetical protein
VGRAKGQSCSRCRVRARSFVGAEWTHLGVVVLSASLAWLMLARAADRTEVTFPGDHAYPESVTATSDGMIYARSLYEGGIFRVPPGATSAEQWVKPGANDSTITLGEKAGTPWVCSRNLTTFG